MSPYYLGPHNIIIMIIIIIISITYLHKPSMYVYKTKYIHMCSKYSALSGTQQCMPQQKQRQWQEQQHGCISTSVSLPTTSTSTPTTKTQLEIKRATVFQDICESKSDRIRGALAATSTSRTAQTAATNHSHRHTANRMVTNVSTMQSSFGDLGSHNIYLYIYTHVHVYTHTYIYIYVPVYLRLYVYIYIYSMYYMFMYVHTHICTCG